MSLEAFADATRRKFGSDDIAPKHLVEMARWLSELLLKNEKTEIRGLMLGVGLHLPWPSSFRELFAYGLEVPPEGIRPLKLTVLASRSDAGIDSDEIAPVERVPSVRGALDALLGKEAAEVAGELNVLPVSLGFRHANPGDRLINATSGRMGPHVQWGSGRQGFLTAGHVAQSVGTQVTDDQGGPLGTVVWSNDPALVLSGQGDIDAALVEFQSGFRARTGRTSVVPAALDVLTVEGSYARAALFGKFAHVSLGNALACYADCYATERLITQPGDSGSLVEVNGGIAGTVIGGYIRRDMTLIQDIDYQLGVIASRAGLSVSL
ncbi:hypothetical protein L2D14_04230 [Thalassospiraceae bacterium LMO-JJ14]|nr:hypothetical protein L2D14_04230 [Thalassospiraceae bacterium LMO-JJ14]